MCNAVVDLAAVGHVLLYHISVCKVARLALRRVTFGLLSLVPKCVSVLHVELLDGGTAFTVSLFFALRLASRYVSRGSDRRAFGCILSLLDNDLGAERLQKFVSLLKDLHEPRILLRIN